MVLMHHVFFNTESQKQVENQTRDSNYIYIHRYQQAIKERIRKKKKMKQGKITPSTHPQTPHTARRLENSPLASCHRTCSPPSSPVDPGRDPRLEGTRKALEEGCVRVPEEKDPRKPCRTTPMRRWSMRQMDQAHTESKFKQNILMAVKT